MDLLKEGLAANPAIRVFKLNALLATGDQGSLVEAIFLRVTNLPVHY